MELKECRLRLAEERRARLKAESRLMEVRIMIEIIIHSFIICFVLCFLSGFHCCNFSIISIKVTLELE